jgi:hypothetical protein
VLKPLKVAFEQIVSGPATLNQVFKALLVEKIETKIYPTRSLIE